MSAAVRLAQHWGLVKDLARYTALCLRRARAAGPAEAVALALRGYSADKSRLYAAEPRHQGLYLTDLQRERTARINPLREILNDKLLFEAYFRGFAPVPRSLALVSAGRVLPLCEDWPALLSGCGPARLVVKPLRGNRGRGVRVIALRPDEAGTPAGVPLALPELLGQLQRTDGHYLLTEFVQQGRFSARLFPGSVNSLRLVTLRAPESGVPFLAAAVQRIGGAATGCTDNFSAGGFSAPIALDSGRLGTAVSRLRAGRRFEHHPDGGVRIEGAVVPDWPRLVEATLAIAARAPFHYVGWDLVVRDEGFALLEGNNMPDVDLLQVHQPLLADPRVRAFFRAHGILR